MYYCVYVKGDTIAPVGEESIRWRIKAAEPKTRDAALPILLYHNIDGKGIFSVDSDALRSHFEMLRSNQISVIRLGDFVKKLGNPASYRQKAAAITFDDGYPSMHGKLMPLAKEFNYPITLFIYTDAIYSRSSKNLTWGQLTELEKNGISIESHTIGHPDLVKLHKKNTPESKKELFKEIYLSRRILQLYLEKPVTFFAFPYGSYSLPLIRLCRLAGYSRVFSTDYGSNIVTRNNYCLRRRHIQRNYPITAIKEMVE